MLNSRTKGLNRSHESEPGTDSGRRPESERERGAEP